MKYFYSLSIILWMVSSTMFSQSFWQRVNSISAANWVQSLSVDSTNGNLYAVTPNGGGIFKSTNNGDSWMMISNGVHANASIGILAIASNGTLYVTLDKLYHSTDGGSSWSELSNSPGGEKTVLVASNGTLYVGTAQAGIHRSTDAGTSWTQINTGLPFTEFAGFTFIEE
ncbi:MAG: hypothetical protein HYZ34_10295 [Ignavibacteriae bacterium]|nr:hypothetical protein [Ignavibacteriota bacterium]